jgi:hypothetical protein
MPEISRFFGIVIYIFYDEHNPPHFHAEYGKYSISVEIRSGIVKGRFPKKQLRVVLDWYDLHKKELMEDWQLATKDQPLKKIKPFEK